MKTEITTDITVAARLIRAGGIVAFPTETVYGLGANVFDEAAIAKIFEAKRRPNDNPLIVHVATLGQIAATVSEITAGAEKFIEAFFPGPLTLVLKKAAGVPLAASAGLDTIGVRMPAHAIAQDFLQACGVPVAAPSANLSGRPSPTTWQAVLEDLDGRIECILQGEATDIGLESTVVDCTGDVPLVLRSGAVSLEQLLAVIPETRIYQPKADEQPRSPGLKHRHYAPSAKVVLGANISDVVSGGRSAFIGLNRPAREFEKARICASAAEYAHSLFAFFRECDGDGIETIFCEPVAESGIGTALMDRLKRAAAAG